MREDRRFQITESDLRKLFEKAGYEVGENFSARVAEPLCDRQDNPIGYPKGSTLLYVEWTSGDNNEW
jgi:hypothetical protein